ncbi:MAG: hypothetical protein ACRD3C_08380 [Vicinamibacterales bacterium]
MAELRIYLTGRIAIEHGATLLEERELAGRQGRLAFAFLAAGRHWAVSREGLTSIVWSDTPPREVDVALNAILSKRFRGKANCTSCHVGPTLTDEQFHNTGVAWHGLPAGSSQPDSFADDGRFDVTGQAVDRGAFKTPTLREIARTAPYMHDGSIVTLNEVVDFYDRGGRANPFLDPELRPLGLTGPEKRSLVTFLRSLSGTMTR